MVRQRTIAASIKTFASSEYEITFAEPDIYQRQQNRDVSEIEYANVIVYQTPRDITELLKLAAPPIL